jgi:mortality factor 4-like protein 1
VGTTPGTGARLALVDAAAASVCAAVSDGLCAYFDEALPVCLLYRFERPQYVSLFESGAAAAAAPCDVYGGEHLLRLLVKLPALLAHAALSEEELRHLGVRLGDLAKWLLARTRSLFLTDAYVRVDDGYVAAVVRLPDVITVPLAPGGADAKRARKA